LKTTITKNANGTVSIVVEGETDDSPEDVASALDNVEKKLKEGE